MRLQARTVTRCQVPAWHAQGEAGADILSLFCWFEETNIENPLVCSDSVGPSWGSGGGREQAHTRTLKSRRFCNWLGTCLCHPCHGRKRRWKGRPIFRGIQCFQLPPIIEETSRTLRSLNTRDDRPCWTLMWVCFFDYILSEMDCQIRWERYMFGPLVLHFSAVAMYYSHACTCPLWTSSQSHRI